MTVAFFVRRFLTADWPMSELNLNEFLTESEERWNSHLVLRAYEIPVMKTERPQKNVKIRKFILHEIKTLLGA